jgi:uncharacterized ion transporter superfamily protein YfcC
VLTVVVVVVAVVGVVVVAARWGPRGHVTGKRDTVDINVSSTHKRWAYVPDTIVVVVESKPHGLVDVPLNGVRGVEA